MEAPNIVHLLPELDKLLLTLLQSLTAAEWQAQTVAKLWTVKDVAAHLLDGNIRILSMLRDGYFGKQANAGIYEELYHFQLRSQQCLHRPQVYVEFPSSQ